MERDRYKTYFDWCRKRKKQPRLRWEGIAREGNYRYKDGLIYEGRKRTPLGTYIPIMRFGGEHIALRYDRRFDVHKVEELRWRLFASVSDIRWPRFKAATAAFRGRGEVYGHYHGRMYRFRMTRRGYEGEGSLEHDVVDIEKFDLLTRLAWEARPSEEHQRLIDEYAKAQRLYNDALQRGYRMTTILQAMLTEAIRNRYGYQERRNVVELRVNGRVYTTSVTGPRNDETEHWPSPFHTQVDLDAEGELAKSFKLDPKNPPAHIEVA